MRFWLHTGLRLFQLREEQENPLQLLSITITTTNGDKLRRIIYNSTKTDKKRRNKNLHNEKWHHPKKVHPDFSSGRSSSTISHSVSSGGGSGCPSAGGL